MSSKIKTSLLVSLFASSVAVTACNKVDDADAPIVAANPADVEAADKDMDAPILEPVREEADKAADAVTDKAKEVEDKVKEEMPKMPTKDEAPIKAPAKPKADQ